MYSFLQPSIRICASSSVSNISRSSNSSLSFPLNDSMYPFSQGLPGSMNSVFTSNSCNHSLTALDVNSGPLSDLMYSGVPLNKNSWYNSSSTSWEVMLRFTRMLKHSREYSSTIARAQKRHPVTIFSDHEVPGPSLISPLGWWHYHHRSSGTFPAPLSPLASILIHDIASLSVCG